jgi:hypothetical protein
MRQSRDNDILIAPCEKKPALATRLNVDDFFDPDEEEIGRDQIHITVCRWNGKEEETGPCFKITTDSARLLIRELQAAIDKREEDGERNMIAGSGC